MADDRKVFVIHGRNLQARSAMFAFLRAIGLEPIEWDYALAATKSASPYVGQALDAALDKAAAVIVLLTPDDIVQLAPEYSSGPDDPEVQATRQARPNVLFEAGMAFGRFPDQTVLVELGALRPFSDVAGRHAVRLSNSPRSRNDLANRLRTAGCAVDTTGGDWLEAGDFTAPESVSDFPRGRRLESVQKSGPRLDGKYLKRGSGSDRIQIVNRTSSAIMNIVALNVSEFEGVIHGFPIEKLPGHKTASLPTMMTMGSPARFELKVSAETESGDQFEEDIFLDLSG